MFAPFPSVVISLLLPAYMDSYTGLAKCPWKVKGFVSHVFHVKTKDEITYFVIVFMNEGGRLIGISTVHRIRDFDVFGETSM